MTGVSIEHSLGLMTESCSEVGNNTSTKNKRKSEDMKFITFWEYDKKNEAALFEKFKTRPEAKIKRLFPPCCLAGQTRGFTLSEEEDIENLEKFAHHYAPYLRFKIHPIIELKKVAEIREY